MIVAKLDSSKIAPCSESINTINIEERMSRKLPCLPFLLPYCLWSTAHVFSPGRQAEAKSLSSGCCVRSYVCQSPSQNRSSDELEEKCWKEGEIV